ncbi:hypothetical protein GE061_001745 [Apolygus lucorum]|uniref:Uncharacterized protein n=1 Tax=Apolygus lucorum TaxID=248454 RepID=A0A8S9Y7Z7_APOLU|nr:hypothetical protein GE061_001745 [Apolygus lucorum]
MGDSTVRRVLRGVFTREANQLRDLLNSSADLEQHELKARMLALSSRYDKIKMVDNAILLAMESDPQVDDFELESQYEETTEMTVIDLTEEEVLSVGREPDEEDPTQDESESIFTKTGRLVKPREILDL